MLKQPTWNVEDRRDHEVDRVTKNTRLLGEHEKFQHTSSDQQLVF